MRVGPPDPVDQLHPGQHPAGVAQQHLKQFELLQRQLNILAAHGHHVPVHVHPHRPGLHDRADRLIDVAPAPEYRAHPGDQFPGRERLGHVVVGAELEADDLVNLTVLRGQHDDRHVRPFPQAPADLAARQAGQHEVEQHQVGTGAVEGLDGVRPGRAHGHLESLLAQHASARHAGRDRAGDP